MKTRTTKISKWTVSKEKKDICMLLNTIVKYDLQNTFVPFTIHIDAQDNQVGKLTARAGPSCVHDLEATIAPKVQTSQPRPRFTIIQLYPIRQIRTCIEFMSHIFTIWPVLLQSDFFLPKGDNVLEQIVRKRS